MWAWLAKFPPQKKKKKNQAVGAISSFQTKTYMHLAKPPKAYKIVKIPHKRRDRKGTY